MSRVFLLALTALALTIGAASAQAQTKMTKNFWVYSGTKFRRGGAEGALLGSAGTVRKTFGKAFDYERKESLSKLLGPKGDVKVRRPTRVTGSSVNEFSKDSVFKYLTFSVSDTLDQLRRGELDLVKLEIASEGDLIRAINASPTHLERLRDISPKNKLRIVTAVWVVVKAKEYSDFKATANGSFSFNGYSVRGDHAGSSGSEWTISPRTIFAYQFSKVNWSKGRKKIESLKVDRANM